MTTLTTVAIIVAIVALCIALWAVYQVRTTRRLRSRFGPEYDYTVQRNGDRRRAEAELTDREARVKKLQIRRLTREERERFSEEWRRQQARFVDDPSATLTAADELVAEVMTTRGYPAGDFDAHAADISVDHAHVIGQYREAHAIAERNRAGRAETEDLRQAMICYRALFEELVGVPATEHPHQEVLR
jgi:hypothetical protein